MAQFKPQKSLTFAVEARGIKNEGFWDAIRPTLDRAAGALSTLLALDVLYFWSKLPFLVFDGNYGCNSVTLPTSRQGMFMRELDNGAVLEAIKVPSLIIQGKDDRIVLSASSDNIARHIPHISRVDYDHCGHVPFVEAAEQFNRDVVAFMQRVHG